MEKKKGLRKGAWTYEEDNLLKDCIHKYGEGKWHLVPKRAGTCIYLIDLLIRTLYNYIST